MGSPQGCSQASLGASSAGSIFLEYLCLEEDRDLGGATATPGVTSSGEKETN
jgi:hypothetical protein